MFTLKSSLTSTGRSPLTYRSLRVIDLISLLMSIGGLSLTYCSLRVIDLISSLMSTGGSQLTYRISNLVFYALTYRTRHCFTVFSNVGNAHLGVDRLSTQRSLSAWFQQQHQRLHPHPHLLYCFKSIQLKIQFNSKYLIVRCNHSN